MSDARSDVLAGIRRGLGVTGREGTRRENVSHRLARHPRGVVPARGQLPEAERLTLFKAQAEKTAATVTILGAAEEVPAEIARFLREANLPATLRRGEDPRLAALPWDKTSLTVTQGASDGSDLNAVSHAYGGVAETGTLVLVSGPDNPTSLNFLPDTHIVVLAAADIAGDFETVLDRLPRGQGGKALPRAVNFVSGPSRSADIEQTLILGAHGPRRLHIVVVAP
jgi:L-lactate dehydrogenase complex protein LldG